MKDAITLAILTLAFAASGHADILTLKSGEDFDGVIRQIADGKVQMQMGTEVRTFNVLDVDAIEFNTPHLLDSADRALDHFLTDLDAQEVVENFAELEATREEISEHMDAARTGWTARQPIAPEEEEAWDRAREDFARPLSRYQEVLGDLYFHVLAKVDEYNRLAREADDIYVGVRGAFNVGASLLPDGEGELQPEGYVPASWYDMIFYEGYRRGYEDAYPAEGYPDDQPEE
jgi:hypothetical protein